MINYIYIYIYIYYTLLTYFRSPVFDCGLFPSFAAKVAVEFLILFEDIDEVELVLDMLDTEGCNPHFCPVGLGSSTSLAVEIL